MQRLKTWLFYLGFATLTTHELDAMTQSEWRVLWLLGKLPDRSPAICSCCCTFRSWPCCCG